MEHYLQLSENKYQEKERLNIFKLQWGRNLKTSGNKYQRAFKILISDEAAIEIMNSPKKGNNICNFLYRKKKIFRQDFIHLGKPEKNFHISHQFSVITDSILGFKTENLRNIMTALSAPSMRNR